jgi:hypothetical protein
MDYPPVNPDARNLEEAFFAQESQRLLARFKEKRDRDARRAALREVMPNADDKFVDHMLELNIGPEMILAITLVPLVAVAWADGNIAEKERGAILEAAAKRGVEPGSAGRQVLESWLSHQPDDSLLGAWKRYVRTLGADLSKDENDRVRESALGLARGVAEAAGGFLGLSKISAAEQAVLDDIERSLA